MSLTAYTHKATPVHAIQFDGTVSGLIGIFQNLVPDPSGVSVTVNFDGQGGVTNVALSGGHPVAFTPTDWIVVPASGELFVLSDDDFQTDWQ